MVRQYQRAERIQMGARICLYKVRVGRGKRYLSYEWLPLPNFLLLSFFMFQSKNLHTFTLENYSGKFTTHVRKPDRYRLASLIGI